ncbi:MAG: hypothetical protein P9M00_05180 [Candidatus Tritonobacter lacicola]|nr:hypothetical protein [Candidatus Tritonobacter lacicola]
MKKRRPATEWFKWYKKIVLYVFYSLAEGVIIVIESIERLLGGDVSILTRESGRNEGDTIRVVADKEIDYQKALPPLVELMKKATRLCDVHFSEIMKGVDRRPRTIAVEGLPPEIPRELAFRTIGYLSTKRRAAEMIKLLAGRGMEMNILSAVAMRLEGEGVSSKAVLQSLGARVRELRLAKMKGIREEPTKMDVPDLLGGLGFSADENPSLVYIDVSRDSDRFISVAGRVFAADGLPKCCGLADPDAGTVLAIVIDEEMADEDEPAALILFGI